MVSLLHECGSVGVEVQHFDSDPIILRAFFSTEQHCSPDPVVARITPHLSKPSLESLTTAHVPDEDWLKRWRESLHPFDVGATFRIVPTSCADKHPEAGSKNILHIEPGMAFGTGTHESTQWCLQAMESLQMNGKTVLDVGTGAGILAIAAVLCGAIQVFACDVDPMAVGAARENFILNRVRRQIQLWGGSINALRDSSIDLCFANLTARIFEDLWPELDRVIRGGGHMVCAGILREQAETVRRLLPGHGFSIERMEFTNEWVGILAHKEKG